MKNKLLTFILSIILLLLAASIRINVEMLNKVKDLNDDINVIDQKMKQLEIFDLPIVRGKPK